MDWDYEKVNEFINHFGLSAKEVAFGIGVTNNMMFKIRNGYVKIDEYESRINAFMEATKKAKILQLQMMIDFYQGFK